MSSLVRFCEYSLSAVILLLSSFLFFLFSVAGVRAGVIFQSVFLWCAAGFLGYVLFRAWRRSRGVDLPGGLLALKALGAHVVARFEFVFVFMLLTLGTVYSVLTPPMQVSDEAAHFYRAYEVSELNFSATGEVPRSVAISGVSLVGSLPGRRGERASLPKILANFSLPLEESDRYQLTNGHHTARHYPPVAYAGSALGIAFGKLFSFPPVVLMYLGRLFNVFFFAALALLVYRTLPFGKLLFAVVALLPMTLSLGASISADGPTALMCFLSVAAMLRFAQSSDRLTKMHLAGILALITLSVLAKNGAYIAFTGLVFLLPPTAFPSSGLRRYGWQVCYFLLVSLVAAGLVLLWQRYMLHESVYDRMASDTGTQRIVERPWEYVKWLIEVATQEKDYMLDTYVGRLGWNDTRLPAWIRYSAIVVIGVVSLFINQERRYATPWQRFVLLGIATANILLIYYAFFSLGIEGMQGRYFIPLSLCVLLPLSTRYCNLAECLSEPRWRRVQAATLMTLIVYFLAVHLTTFQTLVYRFWVE